MGGGASSRPDESALLPSPPAYDLPLWNEHSKGKLLGKQKKANGVSGHMKHQKKAFDKFLPSVRQNIAGFKAEGEKGMEAFAKFGRWMVNGTCEEEVIDANAVLDAAGGARRNSALRQGYVYDNSKLKTLVTRPKGVPRTQKLPGILWAHGGGIATTAKNWDFMGKAWAKNFQAVVFNVDFRHGGDAEAPAGTMDMLAALKWVLANADDLSVDKGRISVMANSGGGFEATTLCLELAAREEAGLVKAVFLDVPMIFPDDMLGPYEGMSDWKRFEHEVVMKQQYMCYGGKDWEARWKEKPAWLNVLAAPEELVLKAPKQVVLSMEFDMMRWQTDNYAAKLYKAGVLGDYVLLPGANHMDANPFTPDFVKIYQQAFKLYG